VELAVVAEERAGVAGPAAGTVQLIHNKSTTIKNTN